MPNIEVTIQPRNISVTNGQSVISVAGKRGAVELGITDIDGLSDALSVLGGGPEGTGFASIALVNQSGAFLQSEILTVSGLQSDLYPRNNPSGYVTQSQTGAFASSIGLLATGNLLQQEINSINTISGNFVNLFYPYSSNPSGYVPRTLADSLYLPFNSGSFLQSLIPNTGLLSNVFYSINNPSGFITSSALAPYATTTSLSTSGSLLYGLIQSSSGTLDSRLIQTGQLLSTDIITLKSVTGLFYLNSNPSGFVNTTQTGLLSSAFYPLNSNPSNYITSSQTGAFQGTGDYALKSYVNSVSGVLDGRLVTTGSNLASRLFNLESVSGLFYLNSNPSGYVRAVETGVLSSIFQPIGDYATNTSLANVSGLLHTQITGSGQYLLGLIQAASAGVSSINSASGVINLIGGGNINVFTAGQTIQVSGDFVTHTESGVLTGAFYPLNTNPKGYLISSDLGAYATIISLTGASGTLQSEINTLNSWTGSSTGLYYPLLSNPSNYLTSLSATGTLTGVFYPLNSNPLGYLVSSDLVPYASISYVNNISGLLHSEISTSGSYLQAEINSINNISGGFTGLFYPYSSNPANYATVGLLNQASGDLEAHLNTSGSYLYGIISSSTAGVSSINSLTGITNISGAGSVVVSEVGQTIIVSGSAVGTINKYAAYIGDGSATTIIVNHNLGTTDLLVGAYISGENVIVDNHVSGVNNTVFTFASAPPISGLRVVIAG